jgi:uncharacterized protein YjbI with pentapeptide repeats
MANSEHFEIIKKGIEVWNKWREENPDIKPDLRELIEESITGLDLFEEDLYEKDLEVVNELREVVLVKNFNKANLNDVDFSRSEFGGENLCGADLKDTKFIRAGLQRTNLSEAKLINADLSEVDLTDAKLIKADLSGANLSRANLNGADLSEAILINADLTETDLRNTKLIKTVIRGANLISANLNGADLNGADLRDVKLIKAIICGANLINANLNRADLNGADLSDAILIKANISDANLNGAVLRGVNLSGADLSGAKLISTDINTSNLNNATLTKANLTDARLDYCSLIGTNLRSANLTGCNIYGISVWDSATNEETIQKDLIITKNEEPIVKVDNLEVAQFIYLILNNKKLHDTLDTICRKVVLILGRFTDDRKTVLEDIKEAIRQYGYIPILFDFEKPESKSFIETILTLANLARFIIADFTDEKIILHEASQILNNTAVPILPLKIIGQYESVTMLDLRYQYNNQFLDTCWYENKDLLLLQFEQKVIKPAEAAVNNLSELRLKIYRRESK